MAEPIPLDAIFPAHPSVPERLVALLSESHDPEHCVEFRLGLLQGALAVALPDLLRTHDQQDRTDA